MAKILIKTALINKIDNSINKWDVVGIKNNNKIIYFEDNKKVTIELKDNKIIMIRYVDNHEYIYFEFEQNNSICKYYIDDKYLDLQIKINEIKIEHKKINIDYIINDQNMIFSLEYESVIE